MALSRRERRTNYRGLLRRLYGMGGNHMKSTSEGEATSLFKFPVSTFAQSVAFDLVINRKFSDIDFVDVFAHGNPAAVSERRQAVFIDVKHNRLYATIWHAGLDQEVILTSPVGSL